MTTYPVAGRVHTVQSVNVAVTFQKWEGRHVVVEVPDSIRLIGKPYAENGVLVIEGMAGGGDIHGSISIQVGQIHGVDERQVVSVKIPHDWRVARQNLTR